MKAIGNKFWQKGIFSPWHFVCVMLSDYAPLNSLIPSLHSVIKIRRKRFLSNAWLHCIVWTKKNFWSRKLAISLNNWVLKVLNIPRENAWRRDKLRRMLPEGFNLMLNHNSVNSLTVYSVRVFEFPGAKWIELYIV